jgi:hypothetical protein
VVVAAEVEHAVHHGLGEVLGVLRADHDIAELARPSGRAGLVDREGQDVGGAVAPPVLAVQLADASLSDELDREMPVVDPGGGERGEGRPSERFRRVDEVELDQLCCWRRGARSAGACFSAYSL